MTRILTSSAGQQYAVDDDFDIRLQNADIDVWFPKAKDEDRPGEMYVEGYLADLLDFLSAEGLI